MMVVRIERLTELVGQPLGASSWHRITQQQVNLFAEATGDRQWIHFDRRRAKAGPFRGRIAHGYLTLSLGPPLLEEVLRVEDASLIVNYGLNRVRFPAPVPVSANLRLSVALAAVEPFDEGLQATLALAFEIEGGEKPACVAEAILRFYR